MHAGHSIRPGTNALLFALLIVSAAWANPFGQDPAQAVSNLRWEEGRPGCTFSRDDDGKYRYGFWSGDFGVVLAVDSQELEKVRRRAQPIFALLLTVHYRGKDSLDVVPGKIALEFVKHYHDVQSTLDPDSLLSSNRRRPKPWPKKPNAKSAGIRRRKKKRMQR